MSQVPANLRPIGSWPSDEGSVADSGYGTAICATDIFHEISDDQDEYGLEAPSTIQVNSSVGNDGLLENHPHRYFEESPSPYKFPKLSHPWEVSQEGDLPRHVLACRRADDSPTDVSVFSQSRDPHILLNTHSPVRDNREYQLGPGQRYQLESPTQTSDYTDKYELEQAFGIEMTGQNDPRYGPSVSSEDYGKESVFGPDLHSDPPAFYWTTSYDIELASSTSLLENLADQPTVHEKTYMSPTSQRKPPLDQQHDIGTASPINLLYQQHIDITRKRHDDKAQRLIQRYVEASRKKCLKSHHKMSGEGIYHCTSGCGATFKRKDDWRRHEEINQPQNFWICNRCPLPLEKVFLTHRRDKLQDHVRKMHKGVNPVDMVSDSKVKFNPSFNPRCGFCGYTFESWAQRNYHIISHFEGEISGGPWTMSRWRDPWTEDDADGSDNDSDNDSANDEDDYSDCSVMPEVPNELSHSAKENALPFGTQGEDSSASSPHESILFPDLHWQSSIRSPFSDYIVNRLAQKLALQLPYASITHFGRLLDQLNLIRRPQSMSLIFENRESVGRSLKYKARPSYPVTTGRANRQSGLRIAIRPDHQQELQALYTKFLNQWCCCHEIEPDFSVSPSSRIFENKSEDNREAITLLQYSLHRSPLDLLKFRARNIISRTSLISGNGIDTSTVSSHNLPTQEDSDLAGIGSHLDGDNAIRHHTQGLTSQHSSSSDLAQSPNSASLSSKATGKRRLGEGEESDPNQDREGNPKKPRKSKTPSPARKSLTLACPIQKHEMEHGMRRTCKGVAAPNPSYVRRHLREKHHIFVELCHQCNTHILDEQEWETRHGEQPHCVPQSQVRKDLRGAQWEALYMKLFPEARRIPSPWNGDDSFKPAPPRQTITEAPVDVPLTPAEDAIQSSTADDVLSLLHLPAIQLQRPSANTNQEHAEPADQTDTPILLDLDEFLAQSYENDEEEAIRAVSHFTEEFINLTNSLPVQPRTELTRLVQTYFHQLFQDVQSSSGIQPSHLPAVTSPNQRTNDGFTQEFTNATYTLSPYQRQELTQRVQDYFHGSYHAFQTLGQVQAAIPRLLGAPSLSLPVQDSGYGTGTSGPPDAFDPYKLDDSNPEVEPQWSSMLGGRCDNQQDFETDAEPDDP